VCAWVEVAILKSYDCVMECVRRIIFSYHMKIYFLKCLVFTWKISGQLEEKV